MSRFLEPAGAEDLRYAFLLEAQFFNCRYSNWRDWAEDSEAVRVEADRLYPDAEPASVPEPERVCRWTLVPYVPFESPEMFVGSCGWKQSNFHVYPRGAYCPSCGRRITIAQDLPDAVPEDRPPMVVSDDDEVEWMRTLRERAAGPYSPEGTYGALLTSACRAALTEIEAQGQEIARLTALKTSLNE